MVGSRWIARDEQTCLFRISGRMGSTDHEGRAQVVAPGGSRAEACSESRIEPASREVLSRTIEVEIIPRLMRAHPRVEAHADPSPAMDVEAFVAKLIEPTAKSSHAYVDALLADEVPLESVFVDLFVPAARHVGALWMDDRCSFSDVTIALARLQQLLSEHAPAFSPISPEEVGARVLLAPAPGEQHTFGLHVVAEFFRRAEWSVHTQIMNVRGSLTDLVSSERFEMVGFSVSNGDLLDPLRELIAEIRDTTVNPDVVVMVGGSPALDLERVAGEIGASTHAPDAQWAVDYMQRHRDGGFGKRGR